MSCSQNTHDTVSFSGSQCRRFGFTCLPDVMLLEVVPRLLGRTTSPLHFSHPERISCLYRPRISQCPAAYATSQSFFSRNASMRAQSQCSLSAVEPSQCRDVRRNKISYRRARLLHHLVMGTGLFICQSTVQPLSSSLLSVSSPLRRTLQPATASTPCLSLLPRPAQPIL